MSIINFSYFFYTSQLIDYIEQPGCYQCTQMYPGDPITPSGNLDAAIVLQETPNSNQLNFSIVATAIVDGIQYDNNGLFIIQPFPISSTEPIAHPSIYFSNICNEAILNKQTIIYNQYNGNNVGYLKVNDFTDPNTGLSVSQIYFEGLS